MMRKGTSSKSSLFLLEVMVSVLFFALSASVCIQVFVKAHQLSREAEELNMAAGIASSAAELLASEKGEEQLPACYDEDWMPCGEDTAEYFLETDVTWEDGYKSGMLRVTKKDGTCIYELEAGHYFPWEKEGTVKTGE